MGLSIFKGLNSKSLVEIQIGAFYDGESTTQRRVTIEDEDLLSYQEFFDVDGDGQIDAYVSGNYPILDSSISDSGHLTFYFNEDGRQRFYEDSKSYTFQLLIPGTDAQKAMAQSLMEQGLKIACSEYDELEASLQLDLVKTALESTDPDNAETMEPVSRYTISEGGRRIIDLESEYIPAINPGGANVVPNIDEVSIVRIRPVISDRKDADAPFFVIEFKDPSLINEISDPLSRVLEERNRVAIDVE